MPTLARSTARADARPTAHGDAGVDRVDPAAGRADERAGHDHGRSARVDTRRGARSPGRAATRGLAAVVIAVTAALGGVLAGAGAAAAEEPQNLTDEVTDLAGVLTPEQLDEATQAVDALADATPYQLFVVLVRSFDDLDPADWADRTAVASGLGRDDILLAVAVDDRRYQVSVDGEIAFTDDQLAEVESGRIEPALRDDDWAGAITAAAAGYEAEAGTTSGGDSGEGGEGGEGDGADDRPAASPGTVGAVLAGIAVVGVGGVVAVRLVRRRRAARALEAELDALDARAASALVAVDEAVATSAQELGFAEAQLGAAATAPFATALDEARARLADAFAARQRLDDTQPEAPDERRALLQQILDTCAGVDAVLDAQQADFERLRDTHARAPQTLADADQEAARLDARSAQVAATLTDLTVRYAPAALAGVARNVEEARAGLDHVRATVRRGVDVLESDRPAAVAAAQDATRAVAHVGALLDAVDTAARELAAAPESLRQAVADLDADLVDAARLGAADPAVGPAADRARAALVATRAADAGRDPLRALDAVRSAERALDGLLAPLREAEAARARAVARLPQARVELDAALAAATSTIDAHRSTVLSTARTRIAEARRHAQRAAEWPADDPVGALANVETATRLAVDAREAALADVASARAEQSWSGSWGTSGSRSGGFGGSGGWGDLLLGGSGGSGGSGGGWSGGSSRRRSSSRSSFSSSRSRSSTRSSSRRSSSSGRSRRGGGGRF